MIIQSWEVPHEVHESTWNDAVHFRDNNAHCVADRLPSKYPGSQRHEGSVQQPVPVAVGSGRVAVYNRLYVGMPPEDVRDRHPGDTELDLMAATAGGAPDKTHSSHAPEVHSRNLAGFLRQLVLKTDRLLHSTYPFLTLKIENYSQSAGSLAEDRADNVIA